MQYYTTSSAHVADCAFYGGFSCGHTFYNCDVGQYIYQADLATERERHFTTGKRAERTNLDFQCPICHSAISQASYLVCARRCQLTFPFNR